jgi:16S rRNA (cytosine1402-N4)-methyltransferase
MPGGILVGIDQDPAALAAAETRLAPLRSQGEVFVRQGNFRDLDTLLGDLGLAWVDAILFDVGVSSPQLDSYERGFSFHDAGTGAGAESRTEAEADPRAAAAFLDMRMNPDGGTPTAAELLAQADEAELVRILRRGGEERWAGRIARAIVRQREQEPLTDVVSLRELVKAAIPAAARRQGRHPARLTFQALRIAVNDELGALETGLEAAIRWLRPGGRVATLSFHSLEDRIVKRIFSAHAGRCVCPPDLPVCACGAVGELRVLTPHALRPTQQEVMENPRARSTRLRVAERL